MPYILRLVILVVSSFMHSVSAADEGIRVFTSDNPESNALRSFIVVPAKYQIPHGISMQAADPVLKKQPPFRIEILDEIAADQFTQWSITTILWRDFKLF